MISTTQCQHCGGAVEFELDAWQEGAVGDCPHCHVETPLRRVDIFAPPPDVARNRSEALARLPVPAAAKKWRPLSAAGQTLLLLAGLGMIALGVFLLLVAGNAINEVAAVLIGCTGLLLVAVAAVIEAIRNLANKP